LISHVHPKVYGYAERVFKTKINWQKVALSEATVLTLPPASGASYEPARGSPLTRDKQEMKKARSMKRGKKRKGK
jgi:hypothetical protein